MVIVRLQSAGPQKIATIKVVRELSGCGLKEAKDLVESAPVTLRLELQSDANQVVASFAAVGVTVEVLGDIDDAPQGPAPDGPGPFHVVVDDIGARKIHVIKVIRDATRLDLLSAKNLADRRSFTLEQEYDRAAAERVAALFGRAGARAHIVPAPGAKTAPAAPSQPTKPPPGKMGPIPYF